MNSVLLSRIGGGGLEDFVEVVGSLVSEIVKVLTGDGSRKVGVFHTID